MANQSLNIHIWLIIWMQWEWSVPWVFDFILMETWDRVLAEDWTFIRLEV